MEVVNLIDVLPRKAPFARRRISQIEGIVIHHFAGKITWDEAARLHIKKWGRGISYYKGIDLDGTSVLLNYLDAISYHCGGHNTKYIGLVLRGNWDNEMPPQIMLDQLDIDIVSLRRVLGDLPVYGHYRFRPTACPGGCLREYIEQKYPSPAPLKVELNWFTKTWRKLFVKEKDHDLI